MVLTQRFCFLQSNRKIPVSIPLWFSRNSAGRGHRKIERRVSIPLWFSRNVTQKIQLNSATKSFHTTMVLTQRSGNTHMLPMLVSFPYHYGSHATLFKGRGGESQLVVSIPLWFSRNFVEEQTQVVSSRVSIPLWFSRNEDMGDNFGESVVVSIPLWFSRNSPKNRS